MNERRHVHRYELCIPLEVSSGPPRLARTQSAHLRDISTHGIYFLIDDLIPVGTPVDIQFALPPERGRSQSVLVRGTGRALRVDSVPGENGKLFGVAASIHRFDFVRPDERAA
jgi:hypothetical protein